MEESRGPGGIKLFQLRIRSAGQRCGFDQLAAVVCRPGLCAPRKGHHPPQLPRRHGRAPPGWPLRAFSFGCGGWLRGGRRCRLASSWCLGWKPALPRRGADGDVALRRRGGGARGDALDLDDPGAGGAALGLDDALLRLVRGSGTASMVGPEHAVDVGHRIFKAIRMFAALPSWPAWAWGRSGLLSAPTARAERSVETAGGVPTQTMPF